MKTLGILILAILGARLSGQVLLNDNFSGGSLDTGKWQTILPTGSSSVSQSGGVLTTTGRGILATANPFSTPHVISGVFTMQNDLEHFNITFRTNLSDSGSSYERPGMLVAFSNDGNEVSIQRFTNASDWNLLAGSSYSLTTGQSYTFSITDTGSSITLAINGTNVISATSTYSTGNYIGFYSREFASTSTAIDSVTISAIPEPSTYALIAGAIALGVIVIRKRTKKSFVE